MTIPFTLRLAYHGFRATLRAGLLFLCAWIFLIPATVDEVLALGAREGTTYPAGLRTMRAAKVFINIAPERAYDIMAVALPQGVSPLMVRIAITQMAAGYVFPASTRVEPNAPPRSTRDIDGPRFIQVD